MELYYIYLAVVSIFLIISYWMIFTYIVNIFKTKKYLKKKRDYKDYNLSKKVSMMIVIPVLREQNIICETIDYFSKLSCKNLHIHLVIAGTKREYLTLEKYGFSCSTREVIEEYIKDKQYPNSFNIHIFEAEDLLNGDRATQLNFAVQQCFNEVNDIDIIGVYDADSRPTLSTILEVAHKYLEDRLCSYQQPAFFIEAANKMTDKGENPLLIANALYQNTWSIISEIPMWIKYGIRKGKSNQYFYCIGHGEFFPREIYKEYKFPEGEVTDGIQIGYRLGICGENVEILNNFCSDDVPHDIKSLIHQHKRWFGGCMRLKEAFLWCKNNGKNNLNGWAIIGGYWSQFRWAFTVMTFIISVILSIYLKCVYSQSVFLGCNLILFVIYCYILPFVATMISPIKSKVKIMPFLLLPIAIFVKSIGPNLYIFNTLTKKGNTYGKVER